ncbi:MAG: UDP-N-acetylmuramoyl-L-alanine--D-glutamate ligase [Rhodocyclaceae bacterium]|nr:UDP-N-acetylmuramoyl-L-alanine--D-glutamate ligase [Rhodocyclaceae bacterium]
MMELSGKHVLVLGLGESGLACARWCVRQGAGVRVADTRAAPPCLDELRHRVPGANFVAGEFTPALLAGIDLVAVSPGLPGNLEVLRLARAAGTAVVGEIELFAQALRGLGRPQVLAITGTNGKTTTTALTGHLLRATGKSVGIAGNISPAALTALMDAQDANTLPQIWVLELSSFQLETTETLNPTAATVLNISDDHLDRYAGLDAYVAAKFRIFQGATAVQVLNRDDPRVRRMALAGRRVISFGLGTPPVAADFGLRSKDGEAWLAQGERCLLPLSELPLAGLHNAVNAMAALGLCASLGLDADVLLPALRSFCGLPHRVEKIAELDGVTWYDDSKGTNVGATVAALAGLGGGVGRKAVVILGGDGKQQDFSPLRDAVASHGRAVVLIGRDAPVIESAIRSAGVAIERATDMEQAVHQAQALARMGDAVLLSPACASFDMFRNYEHRAQAFVAAVRSLERKT